MGARPEKTPYWFLIAVLASSIPMTPALAMQLYETARDLHQRNHGTGRVAGDLFTGEVRNLKTNMVLGDVAGPAFEADLDTGHGHGEVRFLLTRRGLALGAEAKGDAPN